jgi:SAM-dependent methyltransferase
MRCCRATYPRSRQLSLSHLDAGRPLVMKGRALVAAKARFGGLVLRSVRPPWDRVNDQRGTCNVCGAEGRFAFNSWVVPRDIFGGSEHRYLRRSYEARESMICRVCASNQRVRQISRCLIDTYGAGRAASIAELVQQDSFRVLDIAEINAIGSVGSLHRLLAPLPQLTYSEYKEGVPLGQVVDGSRNEDMCRMTYADASFDLVLSSDSLEHVPDYELALREVRRVLRPGGRMILTVPVDGSLALTRTRARLSADGAVTHLLTPVYHGRGRGLLRLVPVGGDMLAFTEFGTDVPAILEAAGFRVEVVRGGQDRSGASWVFCGTVPE